MIDFIKNHKKISTAVAIASSAVLMGLCVMFTQLALLQWIAVVPAAVCLLRLADKGVKFGKAYLYGLAFFWTYYVVIFHWFAYMHPLDFLEMGHAESLAVVCLAWFGLSFLQAVFSALAVPLFIVTVKGVKEKYRCLLPLVAAAFWVIIEYSLTLTWAGVPWSRLALGQIDVPFAVQSVSLFGSYFITFLIVWINFLVAYTLVYKRKAALSVGACVLALNFLVGALMLATYTEGEKITVAAAQGNVSSAEKWDKHSRQKTLDTYEKFVYEASALGAKIVLTPESVLPYKLSKTGFISAELSENADAADVYLLIGAFSTDDNYNLYNSIFAFEPDGNINETIYSKRRLVPFGEFLPFEPIVKVLLAPLAEVNAVASNFTPGRGSNIIATDYAKLGCLICFDSIYETLTLESVRDGAEIIMISTNDSWFSDSAALSMHNNQARLRAIENGRSVVRSANTGISSIITPTGEIVKSIGALKKGVAVAEVEIRNNKTLYTCIGNLFVFICYAFVLGVKIVPKIKIAFNRKCGREP